MVDRKRMDDLKERYINAKTEKERDLIREDIRKACDEDASSVLAVSLEHIKDSHAEIDNYLIRRQLEDVLPCISLAYIAETYFKKSRQWLYQRVNGLMVNGKPARFTPDEIRILNNALQDLARRLSATRVS